MNRITRETIEELTDKDKRQNKAEFNHYLGIEYARRQLKRKMAMGRQQEEHGRQGHILGESL